MLGSVGEKLEQQLHGWIVDMPRCVADHTECCMSAQLSRGQVFRCLGFCVMSQFLISFYFILFIILLFYFILLF